MTTWINHVLVCISILKVWCVDLNTEWQLWLVQYVQNFFPHGLHKFSLVCFPKLRVICILIFMFEVNISWTQVFFKHFSKAFPIITSRSLSFCLDCKCRQSLHFQRQVHLEFFTYLANSNYADYIKPQGNAPPSTEDFF